MYNVPTPQTMLDLTLLIDQTCNLQLLIVDTEE